MQFGTGPVSVDRSAPMLYPTESSTLLLFVGGAAALLVVLVLTPAVGRLARMGRWVDCPYENRSSDRPVALLGGLAIAGATGAAVLATGMGEVFAGPVWVGAALMLVVGLADDVWDLWAEAKILAQVAATILLLYAGLAFWRGGPVWMSVPLTFLWVIGITNALNLIDGIDGLAAGVTAVAAVSLVLIASVLGHHDLAVLGSGLAGASLGFLAYNRPPARIYMGDCGSLFLGYMLAAMALSVQGSGGAIVGTLVPIAVLAVPIVDTTFVTITRLLRGLPVSVGGTDHLHHRLIELGLSETGVVLRLCGASAVFGGAALSTLWIEGTLVLAVAALAFVTVSVVLIQIAPSVENTGASVTATERIGALMRRYGGGASWKSVGGVLADLLVVGAAFVIAVSLRFGGTPPAEWAALVNRVLPGVIGVKLLIFYSAGLYKGIWRHAGTPEVMRLASASGLSSLLVGVGLVTVGEMGAALVPVLILDWGIATAGVGGVRFGFRAVREYLAAHRQEDRNVLVYGSGSEAMLLLRYVRDRPDLDRSVEGLLDENEARHGQRMQGVEVVGALRDLPSLCEAGAIDEVLVPATTVFDEAYRRVRRKCIDIGLPCRVFRAEIGPDALNSASVVPTVLSAETFRRLARLEQEQEPSGTLLFVEVRRPGEQSTVSADVLENEIGDLITTSLRSTDYVGRWSERCFGVLLPDTGERGAGRVAERLESRLDRALEHTHGAPPDIDVAVEPLVPETDLDRLVGPV